MNARFSFISSEDAALALVWLVKNHYKGAFNFASEETIKLRDLIEWIERETGKTANLLSEPVEEAWSPFGITNDWYLNVENSKRLGFQARNLSEWLKPLIHFYAHSGSIELP